MKKIKECPVKISTDKPPVWENACARFKINPNSTLFAYGDIIYNPGKVNIPDDIIAHEMVHLKQQNNNDADAAIWWGKYMRDSEFCLSKEVEAYGMQYAYICQHKTSNRQRQFDMLKIYAQTLSGPLYGSCVSMTKAMELIKEEAKKHETSIH